LERVIVTEADKSLLTSDAQHVGNRIRQLRQAKDLSARDLASRAGLTASYISRIENARVSPTVATLGKVVQAMGETFASLFGDAQPEGPVVRANDRHPLHSHGVDDYRVTPAWASRLVVVESVIQPGQASGSEPHTHPGDEECVLVLDGQLTVWLDGKEYLLGPRDSATYLCRLPHRWRNSGRETSRVLWFITPAIY
jgi:transcriptional regulator with XRE-family HTH domain